MIIDEILYAERLYRDRHRSDAPKRLTLSYDNYRKLCEELDVPEVSDFHGMELEFTDDSDTLIIEEYDYNLDYEDND